MQNTFFFRSFVVVSHSVSLCVCLLRFYWTFVDCFFVARIFFCFVFVSLIAKSLSLCWYYFFLWVSWAEIIICATECVVNAILYYICWHTTKAKPTRIHTIKWFTLDFFFWYSKQWHAQCACKHLSTHSLIIWHFFNWTNGNCTRKFPNCLDMINEQMTQQSIYTQ